MQNFGRIIVNEDFRRKIFEESTKVYAENGEFRRKKYYI